MEEVNKMNLIYIPKKLKQVPLGSMKNSTYFIRYKDIKYVSDFKQIKPEQIWRLIDFNDKKYKVNLVGNVESVEMQEPVVEIYFEICWKLYED